MGKKNSDQNQINFSFKIREIYSNYDFIVKDEFYNYVNQLHEFFTQLLVYFQAKSNNKLIAFEYYRHEEDLINELYKEENIKNGNYKNETLAVKTFNERFFKTFEFSHKNELYYDWCSLHVYKKTLDHRYKDYNQRFVDTDEIEFMIEEYKKILYIYKYLDIVQFIDDRNKKIINKSKNQKNEFLLNFFKNKNIQVNIFHNELDRLELFHIEYKEIEELVNNKELLDLFDSSAIEKILYLHHLGVLDFLKQQQPFLSSTNRLAIVLSAITGVKRETIQPMLNPIFSKNVDNKNNPLNSQIAVDKVTKQLIQLGCKLNKTI